MEEELLMNLTRPDADTIIDFLEYTYMFKELNAAKTAPISNKWKGFGYTRPWLEPHDILSENSSPVDRRHLGLRKQYFARLPEYTFSKHSEIVELLGKAETLKNEGYYGKARKLYSEALKMCSIDADTLLAFAKFENYCGDKIAAEGLLRRIFELDPSKIADSKTRVRTEEAIRKAKSVRSELLADVDRMDNERLKDAYDTLEELQRVQMSSKNAEQALKRMYFLSAYNTLAIEGNHLSEREVEKKLVDWEIEDQRRTKKEEPSGEGEALDEIESLLLKAPSVPKHEPGKYNDQDIDELEGLRMALKHIEQNRSSLSLDKITTEDICRIHGTLMHGSAGATKTPGKFRNCDVSITGSEYTPVEHEYVEEEMRTFVAWINENAKHTQMDELEFCALLHYKFVYIHPFRDGNGRMGRILLDLALHHFRLPPLIVLNADRAEYMESIAAANAGDVRAHVRFIVGCAKKTAQQFLSVLKCWYL